MGSNDRNEIDDLINGALSGYSGAEPPLGLEQRVLNRIRAAGGRRPRSWRWMFAVPVLASLLLAAIALRTWRTPTPAPRAVAGIETATAPPVAAPALKPVRVAEPRRRHRSVRSLPKERQFPAASPITDEERVLLAFATQHPIEAQQAFADLRKRISEPIEIQEIQIQPLQSDGPE